MFLPIMFRISIPSAALYIFKKKYYEERSLRLPVACAAEKQLKLQNVQVVFRHGARTPTVNLPYVNDLISEEIGDWDQATLLQTLPFADIDISIVDEDGNRKDINDSIVEKAYIKRGKLKGGCLTGQLTTVGQKGMYDFGKWLQNEYIEKHQLISQEFVAEELYIRTSFIRRTVLSAQCLIAGLYGKENIKESIVMVTKSIIKEDIYPNWGSCKLLKDWTKSVWFNFELLPQHREDHAKLNDYFKTQKDKPLHFVAVLDFIHCRKAHGMFLPDYLIKNEEWICKRASEQQAMVIGGENNELLRVSIGTVLDSLCSVMEDNNADNMSRHKLYLYSSHDTTIIALLMVLGLWNNEWPHFSSNIVMELYTDETDKKFIRLLYNGEAVILDKENNNDEYYPLGKFQNLVAKYRHNDWEKACEN